MKPEAPPQLEITSESCRAWLPVKTKSEEFKSGPTLLDGTLASVTDTTGGSPAFTDNAQHLLTQIRDFSGGTVQFTYDGSGNMVQSTDPTGNFTSYEYYATGYLSSLKAVPRNI